MDDEPAMEEKRRFGRYPISSLGRIFLEGDPRGMQISVENIGRGGAGLLARSAVGGNQAARLQFPYFDVVGNVRVGTVDGRVVWTAVGQEGARMGLAFHHEIGPDTDPPLCDLLERLEGRT